MIEGLSQSNDFTGKTLYCKCVRAGQFISGTWALTSGQQYATINSNGRIDINSGVQNKNLAISCTVDGSTATRVIEVTYDNQMSIEGSETMSGTSGTVVARYNGTVVTPTWNLTDGQANATIANDGTITIVQSGNITVSASYNNYTTTKTISLTYSANTRTETIVEEDGAVTTITETTIENQDGSTRTETSSTTTNTDGSYSQTSSTTTENQDGSSTTTSETTNSDGTSSETTSTTTAPDQSGATTTTATTTHYDE